MKGGWDHGWLAHRSLTTCVILRHASIHILTKVQRGSKSGQIKTAEAKRRGTTD